MEVEAGFSLFEQSLWHLCFHLLDFGICRTVLTLVFQFLIKWKILISEEHVRNAVSQEKCTI